MCVRSLQIIKHIRISRWHIISYFSAMLDRLAKAHALPSLPLSTLSTEVGNVPLPTCYFRRFVYVCLCMFVFYLFRPPTNRLTCEHTYYSQALFRQFNSTMRQV